MRFARADLVEAKRLPPPEGVYEIPCFHAQQAVEKSFKALLAHYGISVPYTHNLKILLDLLSSSISVPPVVSSSVLLTDYAVTTRYPGEEEPLTEEDHREAVRLADAVVAWANQCLGLDRTV